MIAALYVEKDGAYFGLPDVDPWDEERDARLYAGPWPVVAHPPCARWSRLAGFTEARFGYKRGEHSAKPEAFYDLVETVSPAPYLELFSRRARFSWDTWGDEALQHVDLQAATGTAP